MSITQTASAVMSLVSDAVATSTPEPSKTTVHDKTYQTEDGNDRSTTTIPATKETITSSEGFGYKYNSGLIVRVAIAAGIIVMAVLVIILFLKVSKQLEIHDQLTSDLRMAAIPPATSSRDHLIGTIRGRGEEARLRVRRLVRHAWTGARVSERGS